MSADFLDWLRGHNAARAQRNFSHDTSEIWWTNALAGEAGEAANIAKKISRGDFKTDEALQEARKALAIELADVITYADLLLNQLGYRAQDVLLEKFNVVSARVGYPPIEWKVPTDDQLWALVRMYHGWKNDSEMVNAVGYSLELYVEKMRQAYAAAFGMAAKR